MLQNKYFYTKFFINIPMKGKIYLLPNTLGDGNPGDVIPQRSYTVINEIDHFIVENEKNARRFLIKLGIKKPIDALQFFLLNKHTDKKQLQAYLKVVMQGNNAGVISDAGMPGVADPGAALVSVAHKNNIQVVPLVGPSSVFLSLMASGMNGQHFTFNGYLPIKGNERVQYLRKLEKRSFTEGSTQIFMETPYRNTQIIESIIKTCKPETMLCIAANLTLPDEYICTMSIREWRKNLPDLHKKPAMYLLKA